MKDYLVPSALDTPEIADSVLVEEPYKHSVFGMKGVGEPSIISIVPAIVNAVYHATGIRSQTLPLTPDRFYKLLKEAKK
jgi:CO/xanthine dehydrogenase Mo-binding subunit